jgi:hypothetical protein
VKFFDTGYFENNRLMLRLSAEREKMEVFTLQRREEDH